MDRLTKAALATGAAAVLLLGGAGTMAYWTASSTTTSPPATLTSGTFTVGGAACGDNWTYVSPAPAGQSVNVIVPGDIVQTTCEFTVSGTGDNLALGGAKVTNPVWADPSTNLPVALGDAVITSTTVKASNLTETPDPSTGMFATPLPMAGGTATVDVTIQVTFPYNDTTSQNSSAPVNNLTQAAAAALQNITVVFVQGNSVFPNS